MIRIFVIAWKSITERGNPLWRWEMYKHHDVHVPELTALGTLGEETTMHRDDYAALRDLARATRVNAEAIALMIDQK